MEGVNGLMVAADVRGEGHYTAYPSDKETVALQIPFAGGQLPDHSVLYGGVCHGGRAAPSTDSGAGAGNDEQEVLPFEYW